LVSKEISAHYNDDRCHVLEAAQTNSGPPKPEDTVGNSDKLDLADAYRQALKETVYISLQEKGGDEYTGSGVVVGQTDSKTYILTANHVVSDPLEHYKNPKTRSKHTVTNREVTTADEDKYSARLLNKDPKGDIALLEINVGKNSKHPLQVASVVKDGAGPKPKDSVVFAGYPEDTTTIYMSPGQAGDVQTKQFANSTSRLWLTVLNMRAKGTFGDSGGPVFNAKHQLVGLVEGGTHHDMDALILSKKMLDQWLKPYGIESE
jgi:S1-C subfamily serine protease